MAENLVDRDMLPDHKRSQMPSVQQRGSVKIVKNLLRVLLLASIIYITLGHERLSCGITNLVLNAYSLMSFHLRLAIFFIYDSKKEYLCSKMNFIYAVNFN